jgi:hypothetical protein
MASAKIRVEAGNTSMRVPSATFLPLRMAAIGQVVQAAVGAAADDDLLDRRCPATLPMGLTLSTMCGQAIWGCQGGHVDLHHLDVVRVGVRWNA